jgi:hypothetical protein
VDWYSLFRDVHHAYVDGHRHSRRVLFYFLRERAFLEPAYWQFGDTFHVEIMYAVATKKVTPRVLAHLAQSPYRSYEDFKYCTFVETLSM